MSQLIEDVLPPIQSAGLNTNKATALGSTLSVTGATTLASTLAVTGAASFTVAPTGPVKYTVTDSAAAGATVVLTAAQSGQVFKNVSTSGTPSWTLPTCANGLTYTFICGNTTAGFTVTGAQVIHFKTSATGTALTSTTTLTNTQATAVVGDSITIVGDGTAWWMTEQTGIFAAS